MRKIVLIALLLILCMSGAVLAQEATPAFCGTLSQADCTILQNAQAKMQTLDSGSFSLQLNATVTNVPSEPQPVAFTLTGNGAFSGLQAAQGDPALLQSDPGQYLANVLDHADLDLSLTLNLPPAVTAQDPTVPSTITLQTRLVDGLGYLNTDTLRALMGTSGASVHGWYGLDLANLLRAALQQTPDLFNSTASGSVDTSQYVQALSNPDFINRILKLARTDDGSGSLATFQFTLNMGAMMSSPDFQTMMRQELQAQNGSMTQQEMDQSLAASSQMLKGMTFVLTEDIGTDDGYLHDIKGTINFDTKGMMAVLNSSTTGGSPSAGQLPPVITVDFTFAYADFDSAPAITAPTNAIVIPYQSLLGMMSSQMGSLPSN